ncbi:hypothetical protein [Latilactobacillus curvatus]|uniref:hypothetical protein n=1 Tax=Latilactobacillus curvatus TaxID=28038 RepID=UPI0032D56A81
MKSPEQELYDYFFKFALTNHWNTYDHLPMDNRPEMYPFVVVGDIQVVPNMTKTSLNGNVIITIDVWGDDEQRLTVSDMVKRFFHTAIGTICTEHYRFYGRANEQSKELTQDQSVPNVVFNRGQVQLNLNIM